VQHLLLLLAHLLLLILRFEASTASLSARRRTTAIDISIIALVLVTLSFALLRSVAATVGWWRRLRRRSSGHS
jgi:hypothetical protein